MATSALWYGDNLDILRERIATESVDLIYLDPPFNSNRSYNVLFGGSHGEDARAQIEAFDDTWTWAPETEQLYLEMLSGGAPGRVADALQAMHGLLGEGEVMAYLVMMAARLVELHRVLRPTGSIYLHCDPTASHYLKILMDAILGPRNFRNEITWKRTHSHGNVTRNYGAVTDTLLLYARGPDYTWNQQYTEFTSEYIERQGSRIAAGEQKARTASDREHWASNGPRLRTRRPTQAVGRWVVETPGSPRLGHGCHTGPQSDRTVTRLPERLDERSVVHRGDRALAAPLHERAEVPPRLSRLLPVFVHAGRRLVDLVEHEDGVTGRGRGRIERIGQLRALRDAVGQERRVPLAVVSLHPLTVALEDAIALCDSVRADRPHDDEVRFPLVRQHAQILSLPYSGLNRVSRFITTSIRLEARIRGRRHVVSRGAAVYHAGASMSRRVAPRKSRRGTNAPRRPPSGAPRHVTTLWHLPRHGFDRNGLRAFPWAIRGFDSAENTVADRDPASRSESRKHDTSTDLVQCLSCGW